ncbi:DEAD/DEAH box helicase [Tessaracoccus terricola]
MDWNWLLERDEVVALRRRGAGAGATGQWPQWLPAAAVDSIRAAEIEQPWQHQAEFAELAFAGRHAAICTPTGSGKSLAYLMPVIAATTEGRFGWELPEARSFAKPRHTALYLAPTKALAHDQYRAARELAPKGWRVGTLDGDSEQGERRFAREHAQFVLSNPDMLHFSVLANHEKWARFLGGLRYVVVDEAHRYQGVFGAHVAAVLRRLRRLCALYGTNPTMLLCSATAPNAAEFGGALIGEDGVEVVDESTAPTSARTVALWQPKGSLNHDTSQLLAGLSDDGAQTLAFVPSRAGAELVAVGAQEEALEPERIASYRAGYLASDRRGLEAALQSGELRGLATTNALELGVDVSGVEAVLVSGYPGKLSSFWQQAGRAGRAGQESLVVLLARENPLDTYLLAHPELVFDAPVEHAVCHPGNPHVLGPHLAAAAQEHPLSAEDERWFGPQTMALVEQLTVQGVLRDRGGRWFWTRPDRAVDFINLRATGPAPIEIIERETGRVLGIVSDEAADRTVHPEAVYLHQGETWAVTDLDRDEHQALVTAVRPHYYTQAQSTFDIEVLRQSRRREIGVTEAGFGDVLITSRVVGYLRRDEVTHDVLDASELEMPKRQLRTQAVWWTVPRELERVLRWPALRMGAAAHAMEHTAIGLLPVFAPCDRWDIGGVSTAAHPDTGLATIFVHDGMDGGSGFAARGFEVLEEWLAATLERLDTCRCDDGCPACVVSPRCGNANQVLDKADATSLLRQLLGAD